MDSLTSDMTSLQDNILIDKILRGGMNRDEKDDALEQLWERFGNVSVTDADTIDEDFLVWKKGTDRFDIWHWFDEEHSRGVAVILCRRREGSYGKSN